MVEKEAPAIVVCHGFITNLAFVLAKRLRQNGISDKEIHEILKEAEASDEIIDKMADRIAGVVREMQGGFVKLISEYENPLLDAVDGNEVLAHADDVFEFIDADFKKWGADKKGPATQETQVCVYEMEKDATFEQIFGSLSTDIRRLCLTQAQVKNFVIKHSDWLRTSGYETFFPFEANDQVMIAGVQMYSGFRLKLQVYRSYYAYVWFARHRRRVVVPLINLA